MPDLVSAAEETGPTPEVAPDGPRRWRRLVPAAAVAVAVAAATGWWVASLSAYDDEGGYRVSGRLPAPGSSLLVGLGGRPLEGSVTLVDVVPLVTSNTADADLRVVVCDQPEDGAPPGVVEATAEGYCGRPTPVDGYVQWANEGGEAGPTARDRDGHLVLEVTPRRPGTVEVDGVRITYRDGLRRQTQVLRAGVRFTSP